MIALYILAYFFVFIFGLCIGSFLNCVVYRLENEQSFLKGRSYCPHCKHTLSWPDLVPIFSFLFLGGKCRYCKKSISRQYPVIEVLTGLLFVLIFNRFSVIPNLIGNPGTSQALWIPAFAGMTAYLFFLFYIASALIVIFIYDLKHYIIPDKVLFPAIAIVFLYRLVFNFGFLNFNPLWAGLGAGAFFLFIFLISGGKWMGFGDVKLALFMGLFLGWPDILAALFLAFFLGAIIGVGLIIFGNKKLKSEIPFGPFLITGTFMAMLWGPRIIDWYLNIGKLCF